MHPQEALSNHKGQGRDLAGATFGTRSPAAQICRKSTAHRPSALSVPGQAPRCCSRPKLSTGGPRAGPSPETQAPQTGHFGSAAPHQWTHSGTCAAAALRLFLSPSHPPSQVPFPQLISWPCPPPWCLPPGGQRVMHHLNHKANGHLQP